MKDSELRNVYKQGLDFRGVKKLALGTRGYEATFQVIVGQDEHITFFFSTRGRILWFLMSSAKIKPGGSF